MQAVHADRPQPEGGLEKHESKHMEEARKRLEAAARGVWEVEAGSKWVAEWVAEARAR